MLLRQSLSSGSCCRVAGSSCWCICRKCCRLDAARSGPSRLSRVRRRLVALVGGNGGFARGAAGVAATEVGGRRCWLTETLTVARQTGFSRCLWHFGGVSVVEVVQWWDKGWCMSPLQGEATSKQRV